MLLRLLTEFKLTEFKLTEFKLTELERCFAPYVRRLGWWCGTSYRPG